MKQWIKISSLALGFLLCNLMPNETSSAPNSPSQRGVDGKMILPRFAFSWADDKNVFQAGDLAVIKVKILDYMFYDAESISTTYAMNLSLTVNDKIGNSSYISGLLQYFGDDPTFWNISFTPIRAGEFPLVISENQFGIIDSSLHFTVTAGHLYPSACIALWKNVVNVFDAGEKVTLFLLPEDAFGNNISLGVDVPSKEYFMLSVIYPNGSTDNVDFEYGGWDQLGYISIYFVTTISGNLYLHVYGDNQILRGTPMFYAVKPGPLDIGKTQGRWKHGTNFVQIFSKLEMFIDQKDQFGNLVLHSSRFDAYIVEKASNLSIPVPDLSFKEVAEGTLLLSFTVLEPGDFTLTVFSSEINETTWKMDYDFKVFIGYCHGSNSFAKGSGLISSSAGRMSHFNVYLEDLYHNPSPIEIEMLLVQIFSDNGTSDVLPVISPMWNLVQNDSTIGQSDGPDRLSPISPKDENQTVNGKPTTQVSDFIVAYTPKISGEYKIWIFCGNVPINNGNPYIMKVTSGTTNIALSKVLTYAPSIQRHMKTEVLVQLVDSYLNQVSLQQSKFKFLLLTANSSSFFKWEFVENKDGLYSGYYIARDVGAYNICVSFEDQNLNSCPFEVLVYEKDYFPDVNSDFISVWENESISFDVLSNDYVPGGQLGLLGFSMPLHGSLLQIGQLFRYTPFKGFFGKDSFSYTLTDMNNNSDTGAVFMSVLCKPPQFVSLPAQLYAIEDILSPDLGGFPGFEITHSDITENLSLTIRAQSGGIFLSPMLLYVQKPWRTSALSISRNDKVGKHLVIYGDFISINSALQLIQYVGNENFYGDDIVTLCATNQNGMQEAHVSIFVKPINDPPIIYAPKFISLRRSHTSNGLQIFDKQRDAFDFSIADPDLYNFQGNKSQFVITLSLEVNDGILSSSLPVSLINVAELKSESNQWQPIQTYVTIANYFVLKGRGIRFRGTVGECNGVMQQLFYQGSKHDSVLTITANDMGNHGCYSDCREITTFPLQTVISVNLINQKPLTPVSAIVLGFITLVEILMTLILGAVLLLFIIKCMTSLRGERKADIMT